MGALAVAVWIGADALRINARVEAVAWRTSAWYECAMDVVLRSRGPGVCRLSSRTLSWLLALGALACGDPESSPAGGGGARMVGSGGAPHVAGSATGGTVGAVGGSAEAPSNADPPESCSARDGGGVAFSVPTGLFAGSISVALTGAAPNAEIRYTLDRSLPSSTSPLYMGVPLTISRTTLLRAQVFLGGVPTGEASTAIYVARELQPVHDQLPVMVVDSYGTAMREDREYVATAVLTFEPATGGIDFAMPPSVASGAGLHLRGQSSLDFDKKPYRLEYRDADGSDRDCPMLQMPPEADWVLHAPFIDKALIRNAFVYSLGQDLRLPSPRAQLIELYVNTDNQPLAASDYQGVYLLVETIKNQKQRLDLRQLGPADVTEPDISGGYIFKLDFHVDEMDQEVRCPGGQSFCWNYLEVTDPQPWSSPQRDYITRHVSAFSDALHSAAPADPHSGYPAFIDIPSFVDQVIVQELVRNLDAYTKSQFFHKERNGKIFAGPLWDYDASAGVGHDRTDANLSVEGWQHAASARRYADSADWFPRLIADASFQNELRLRWQDLRRGVLGDAQVIARIGSITAGLGAAAERNFRRWNNLNDDRVGWFVTPSDPTWQGQVDSMQRWLLARMQWLDTQWR